MHVLIGLQTRGEGWVDVVEVSRTPELFLYYFLLTLGRETLFVDLDWLFKDDSEVQREDGGRVEYVIMK